MTTPTQPIKPDSIILPAITLGEGSFFAVASVCDNQPVAATMADGTEVFKSTAN